MAIELIVYAAPLADGVGLAAPRPALDAIAGAGRILGERQQAVQLSLLAPAGWTCGDERDVRGFYRRAAVIATASEPGLEGGPSGRWHAALVACGWLLILGGGGSAAAVVGGLWLAAGYPLMRRRVRARRLDAVRRAAAGLAHALGEAPIEAREHAGLTRLREIAQDTSRPPAERYRHASAACGALGLGGLSELYEALGRGASPDIPWCSMATVEGDDGSVRQPA
ncbi:MAG TPA: hypothetical protein VFX49_04160 [Chloroflexota bacterium]|nr:hypothetical protein [Chloroflexota bacterium]